MEDPRVQELIDALAGRFYATFDNTKHAPAAQSVAECFAEKAVVARHSAGVTELYTVAEFIAPRVALLNGGGLANFSEWETEARTEIFGGIATRTSRYRKSGLLHGNAYAGSGTKLFQLACVEQEWLIASLSWIDDDA